MNNNPKELYKASNKINSILSKNLRSIYNENKNDINQDNPLFENVNCLIQKNTTSNKYLYNQMTNFKNNLNQKYHRKESNSNTFISNNSEKDFRDSTIIRKMEKLKKNNLFRTSIKNTDFKKKLENLQTNKPETLLGSNQTDTKISNNIKMKKRSSKKNRRSQS